MQFDTGWCARGGEDPWTFMKRNESRIKSLHYKDFNMKNDTDLDVCIGDASKSYWYLMNIGQQRAHTVSYLNIFDTQTGTVKLLQKFDGIVEAPNWVHGDDYLVYNKDEAIYRYDLKTKVSTKIESGIANHCNNDHVVSADEKELD